MQLLYGSCAICGCPPSWVGSQHSSKDKFTQLSQLTSECLFFVDGFLFSDLNIFLVMEDCSFFGVQKPRGLCVSYVVCI
jgi:hypothetical protein